MPPSAVGKKKPTAKPTLNVDTAITGAAKGNKPTPRSKKPGQASDRPKSKRGNETPTRALPEGSPAATSLEPMPEAADERVWTAIVKSDLAKSRAEESERKADDLSQRLAERTMMATREAEGRALAEKRASVAEEKLQAVEAALAAAERRAATAELAAEAAVGTAVAATQDAHKSKSEVLEKEAGSLDAFREAELRAEAETHASAAEARAAEAAEMAKAATELAKVSAAEASASAARAKALEVELNALRSGSGGAGASGPADPVAELVDGVVKTVVIGKLEESLARVEARALTAEQRASRAEAALSAAHEKITALEAAAGVAVGGGKDGTAPSLQGAAASPPPPLPNASSAALLLPVGSREQGGGMATPRSGTPAQVQAAQSLQRVQRGHRARLGAGAVLRQEMSGGAATPRRNENSTSDLPAFTEEHRKAATKIEAISRGRMQRKRSHAAALAAAGGEAAAGGKAAGGEAAGGGAAGGEAAGGAASSSSQKGGGDETLATPASLVADGGAPFRVSIDTSSGFEELQVRVLCGFRGRDGSGSGHVDPAPQGKC